MAEAQVSVFRHTSISIHMDEDVLGLLAFVAFIALAIYGFVRLCREKRELQDEWDFQQKQLGFSPVRINTNQELHSYLKKFEVFQQGKWHSFGASLQGKRNGWDVLLVQSLNSTGIAEHTHSHNQIVALFIDYKRNLRFPRMQVLPKGYWLAERYVAVFFAARSRVREEVRLDEGRTTAQKNFFSKYHVPNPSLPAHVREPIVQTRAPPRTRRSANSPPNASCIEALGSGIAVWLRGETRASELGYIVSGVRAVEGVKSSRTVIDALQRSEYPSLTRLLKRLAHASVIFHFWLPEPKHKPQLFISSSSGTTSGF